MKKRRMISAAFSLALAVQIALPVQLLALFGGGPKIPSANQVAKDLEQRYHIDTQSIQNFGESFNVSNNKKMTPEVSLFFSPTDPREGHKITAKAFPIYFSNDSAHLYYTWYLKQKGCELGALGGKPSGCDADKSGSITVNDWKVAAARILATGGSDKKGFDYGTSTDSDGYSANFGGGNKVNTSNDWCYLVDLNDGNLYELVSSSVSPTFTCSSGMAACLSGSDSVDPATFNASATGSGDPFGGSSSSTSITGETFEYDSTYSFSSYPGCNGNATSCPSGTQARCIPTGSENSTFSAATYATFSSPSCTSGSAEKQKCVHLFPKPSGGTSGDGNFGVNEEDFWGTNPNDPDTADNGNKDEANVVGLGRETFEWNYQSGDMLGVVVEGTSMLTTKHNDSSSAIMWAFSRNNCLVKSKGSYIETIKNYSVTIPTTTMSEDDLNACLENNLIDPLEGGQSGSKKLEIELSATPENPTNDATGERSGDVVKVSSLITNSSRPMEDREYVWTVEIGGAINGPWNNITNALLNTGSIPYVSGNDMLPISLNITNKSGDAALDTGAVGTILGADMFYLRIRSDVSENFSSGLARKGGSDVIIRVSNTDKRIMAYTTTAVPSADGYRVSVTNELICGESYDLNALPVGVTKAEAAQKNLNRIACRVMKNEIIGLSVDSTGLTNFKWTLNGVPLLCGANVSSDADCLSGNQVFFAVSGNPGETYTIRMDAVDTASGKDASVSRMFQVVDPAVVIESVDETLTWPKYIGTHTDLNGASFDEFSDIAFETYTTGNIKLKARFFPGPAKYVSSKPGSDGTLWTADDESMRTWTIDGQVVNETVLNSLEVDYIPVTLKAPGEVYNISFDAMLIQPNEKRKALKEIWGIDTIDSDEIRVSGSIQVEAIDPEYAAQGPKKFLAAISSYLPASILFAFKITLSMALLLFTVGFVFALIPAEPRTDEVILSRRD